MIRCVFCLLLFVLLSCATAVPIKKSDSEPEILSSEKKQTHQILPPPEFIPAVEELLPLKTRIVSISVRAVPLRDVLYVIAEAAGLNVVMEKGVDPEIPITITLRNVTVENALNAILSSVDYFYSIKKNVVIVKAVDTRIFEFGHPPVIQDYAVDVGGDILGVAAVGIRGAITQKIEVDKEAMKLWDSIEKSIKDLLGGRGEVKRTFSTTRMTGTIAVTGTKKDLEKVEHYLEGLKKTLKRRVIIEARIAEVKLTEELKYGIDWSAIIDLNQSRISIGTERFAPVDAQLPTFQIGVSALDFTALLRALERQAEVRVLSNPRANIMNGQTALLTVGRSIHFISRVDVTVTPPPAPGLPPVTTFTVTTDRLLSGIMLGIVPYIDEHRQIAMTITPIVSDLVKLEERVFGEIGENVIQISLPIVDLRQLSTTVKVMDGQMVVIGGLIQKKDRFEENRVPLLSRIPLVGHLFKKLQKVEENTELVIMLKPTIVS